MKNHIFQFFQGWILLLCKIKNGNGSGFNPINMHHLPCVFSFLSKTDYVPSLNQQISSFPLGVIYGRSDLKCFFSWHQNAKVHVKLSNFSARQRRQNRTPAYLWVDLVKSLYYKLLTS